MSGQQQPSDSTRKLTERLDIDFALQAAGLGIWEVDPITHDVLWDERCQALVGLHGQTYLPFGEAAQYIHPDDLNQVLEGMKWAMKAESGGLFDQTHRTLGADGGTLRWVRFWGQAYFTPTGALRRFAGVAQEVTQQLLARQQLSESEIRVRSLIEEAPIATCLFVGRELRIEVINEAMMTIFGKGPTVLGKPLALALPELVGQPFLGLLDEVFTHGQVYKDVGAPAYLDVDGVLGRYYFDSTYKPLRDANGSVYAIIGMAIDVTQQVQARQELEASEARYRQLAEHLEEQVQERTEQLAASNEELAATNEELTATNEDFMASNQALEAANHDLLRSNKNLEQFAYIASHDMQEPLRKIQQFGDLLKNQYGDGLGDGVAYLERMQTAASRMSVLIWDLLAFSRISTTQVIAQPVALNQVVSRVLDTLSVVVEESGAKVEVTNLPVLPGDRSQLDQLFQNLLSNAFKFRRTNPVGGLVTPQIRIKASLVAESDLPLSVQPSRYAQTYHCIEVADNGIGFEEKYVDRMFQVFQRLHGKEEFAGTGIGLAICQKVVTNHGGVITATSQPSRGATFAIYLPA